MTRKNGLNGRGRRENRTKGELKGEDQEISAYLRKQGREIESKARG